VVKRKFVRVKETLYAYRNGKIRVTVKPRRLYLEFDLSDAWFRKRVDGWDLGELILKESELIITFRKKLLEKRPLERIGWDLNKYSIDGFSSRYGWIKIDLKYLSIFIEFTKSKGKESRAKLPRKPHLNL